MKVTMVTKLKEDVTDSSGRTVAEKLNKSGFPDVKDVRIGKVLEIEFATADLDEARSRAEQLAKKIIASEVTEEYLIVDIS